MRSPAPLAASTVAAFVFVLACAPDAEARGRRGGGRSFVGVGIVTGGSSARAETRRRPAAEPARPAISRPILPVRAPAPEPAAVTRAAQSGGGWCGKQRVVGLGAGFCEIN